MSQCTNVGGRYHGKFILPSEYPFKAPDVIMMTKSGRFETGKKICLSFSGYHHELWQPAWTIRSMLTALRAFMESPAKGIGAMSVSKAQRKRLARMSNQYTCSKCRVTMKDIVFPKVLNEADKARDTNGREKSVSVPSPVPPPSSDSVKDNVESTNQDDGHEHHGIDADDQKDGDQNIDENVNAMNDNNDDDQRPQRTANVAASPRENNNEDRNPVITERSPNNNGNVNGQDTRILDSFTIVLVVMILGILMKKFAVTVIDQL